MSTPESVSGRPALAALTEPLGPPLFRPGGVSMHDVAAALHGLRKGHGLAKYASLLQAFNGRPSGIDRLQESLDGLVYDLQVIVERAALAEALTEFRELLARDYAPNEADATAVLGVFDGLFSVEALALRADEIAATLISQAEPGVRDDQC